jgi:hypothetical protein
VPGAQRLHHFWGVVEDRVREAWLRNLGRSPRGEKFRRDISFDSLGIDQWKPPWRRWWSGDPFIEEENRRLESSCRLAKSRGSLDLGEGARRLILRRGEDFPRYVSADRGWRVQ